jgi:hypothetical protein
MKPSDEEETLLCLKVITGYFSKLVTASSDPLQYLYMLYIQSLHQIFKHISLIEIFIGLIPVSILGQ